MLKAAETDKRRLSTLALPLIIPGSEGFDTTINPINILRCSNAFLALEDNSLRIEASRRQQPINLDPPPWIALPDSQLKEVLCGLFF
jgi:hypothetical protein